MLGICVVAAAFQWTLDSDTFTLAWTHSIEKIRWEEDYRREDNVLVLVSARIRGTGAGMEPPPDATWRDGAWHYTPSMTRLPQVVLANSPFGGSYEICTHGRCRILPTSPLGPEKPTVIAPCSLP